MPFAAFLAKQITVLQIAPGGPSVLDRADRASFALCPALAAVTGKEDAHLTAACANSILWHSQEMLRDHLLSV